MGTLRGYYIDSKRGTIENDLSIIGNTCSHNLDFEQIRNTTLKQTNKQLTLSFTLLVK